MRRSQTYEGGRGFTGGRWARRWCGVQAGMWMAVSFQEEVPCPLPWSPQAQGEA